MRIDYSRHYTIQYVYGQNQAFPVYGATAAAANAYNEEEEVKRVREFERVFYYRTVQYCTVLGAAHNK